MLDLDAPIVPSESAAGLKLGQPIDEVLAQYPPITSEKLGRFTKYSLLDSIDLWVDAGRISQIGLLAGYRGKLGNKIGVGSSARDVKLNLGPISEDGDENAVVEGTPGLCFTMKNARVAGIYVFQLADSEPVPERSWQEDARESVKVLTWAGFVNSQEVVRIVCEEVLDQESVDKRWVRKLVKTEFAAKQRAERAWPTATDCDRLDGVFEALNVAGVIALQNAGNTLSEGMQSVLEAMQERPQAKGYCFYHNQDVDDALRSPGLYLAFGSAKEGEHRIKVGKAICRMLQKAGLKYEWDGSPEQRIRILNFTWRRRLQSHKTKPAPKRKGGNSPAKKPAPKKVQRSTAKRKK